MVYGRVVSLFFRLKSDYVFFYTRFLFNIDISQLNNQKSENLPCLRITVMP